MTSITFKAIMTTINSWDILKLPLVVSKKLPSRGLVIVEGTINNIFFQAPLEPDGVGGHWLHIDSALKKKAKIKTDDTLALSIQPSKEWLEPKMLTDLGTALKSDRDAMKTWNATTVKARWEWIRWIRAPQQQETRARRIGVALSKLSKGDKRPCCFDASSCTEPHISKSGVLIGVATTKKKK